MESQDYPTLFRAGDSTSIHAQKRYFLLVRIRVALLLVIAGVASFSWNQFPDLRILAAIGSAVFLVASIALSAVMEMKKFDRIWFSSRAIAESLKMESWKFMMKVEPYDGDDSVAEDVFLKRLDKLLLSQPSVLPEMASFLKEGAQITEHMRQMRKRSLEDRLTYYVQNRIRDQRIWYATKAEKNHSEESRWSIISWMMEIVAAAIAIIIIGVGDPILKPVGIFTTAGAGVLSWIHARSFRELSQSYSLIAQQLTNLETPAVQVSTEGKLVEIVMDVERAISREHTIWLTRRLI